MEKRRKIPLVEELVENYTRVYRQAREQDRVIVDRLCCDMISHLIKLKDERIKYYRMYEDGKRE